MDGHGAQVAKGRGVAVMWRWHQWCCYRATVIVFILGRYVKYSCSDATDYMCNDGVRLMSCQSGL